MKKISASIICLGLCLLMINCKKSDGKIEYPLSGSHGPNLLYPADSIDVRLYELYSIAADLETNSEPIEVHLINLNETIDTLQWIFEPNTINGWNISVFDTLTHLQKLSNYELNHIDVGIKFTDFGPFKIEIFENNQKTPVRSTIINGHITNTNW